MIETKPCRTCGVVKPLSDFGRKSSRPDGHEPTCRACYALMRVAKRAVKNAEPVGQTSSAPSGAPLTSAATDYTPNREVIATFAAIQMIARDGGIAPNMLWLGPSGSGKTEGARDLARRAGLPFFKIDAPSMTDPEAWFGTREVVVQDGAPRTVVNDSEFVRALGQPCILLIDEGNRVSDAVRGILLALWDDSRSTTNPLTGQTVRRHPECYIVMTGNVGLAFTGTYAIDPAFLTRAVTTRFGYLDPDQETKLAQSRTGCDAETARLFVRFATETRQRAAMSEDFPPISTREVLTACALVARGLDANTAAHQVIINAAPSDGGPESIQGQLEMIWTGIRAVPLVGKDDAHDVDEAVQGFIDSLARQP